MNDHTMDRDVAYWAKWTFDASNGLTKNVESDLLESIRCLSAHKGYEQLLANRYKILGFIYYHWGSIESAIQLFQKSLSLLPQDKSGIHHASLGTLFGKVGEPEKALHHFERCLTIEQSQAVLSKSAVFNNLSALYFRLGFLSLAEQVIDTGIAVTDSSKDSGDMCAKAHLKNLCFKAYINIYTNNFKSSEEIISYVFNELENGHELPFLGRANLWYVSGLLSYYQNDMQTCAQRSRQAVRSYQEAGAIQSSYRPLLLQTCSEQDFRCSNDADAEYKLEEIRQLFIENLPNEVILYHKVCSLFWERRGNWRNAYRHVRKAQSIQEEMYQAGLDCLTKRINERILATSEVIKVQSEANKHAMDSMRHKLNPHFIFNALNSVQAMVLSEAPDAAAGFISGYARLMRRIFDASVRSTISLSDEICLLHDYVRIEQARFAGVLSFRADVADEIDPEVVRIPSMVVQPFLENAINHGLRDHPDGLVSLIVRGTPSSLYLHILDNGVGLDRSPGAANRQSAEKGYHSMDALRQRFLFMEEHGEHRLQIKIVNRMSGGAHVAIHILRIDHLYNQLP